MKAARRILTVLGALALCLAALAVGCAVRHVLPALGTTVVCAQEGAEVVTEPIAVARMARVDNNVQGKVMIRDRAVITTVFSNNGVEPYERASIAAARINLCVEQGSRPEDFRAVEEGGSWFVVAGDRMIISVAPMEDQAFKTSAEALAGTWAANITTALHEVFGTQPQPSAATAAPEPPVIEAREAQADGGSVGVLLIDGNEVVRILAKSGSFEPARRAEILAQRLNKLIAEGLQPSEVVAGSLRTLSIVKGRDQMLIGIEPTEAEKHGKLPSAVAKQWASAISGALTAHYAPAQEQLAGATPPEAGGSTSEADYEKYEDRWVPIVSILEGTKLGVARVTGPSDRVGLVQAVAQLETHWNKFLELDVYVPISTQVPGTVLDRVQGCGVTGLGDINIDLGL